jgi:hypothetical protein
MRTLSFFLLIIVSGALMIAGCRQKKAPATESQRASPTPSPAPTASVVANTNDAVKRDLSQIGSEAAAAVLAKDEKMLLSYEQDEPRVEDELALQDTNDPLYCFIFKSDCIKDSKARSVYEIVSGAKNLAIEASVTQSPANGRRYGLLLFYDKLNISTQQLSSEEFLCSDDALKKIASWHFELSEGKWRSTTLFDYATEGLCRED